eukprot:Em0003g901a
MAYYTPNFESFLDEKANGEHFLTSGHTEITGNCPMRQALAAGLGVVRPQAKYSGHRSDVPAMGATIQPVFTWRAKVQYLAVESNKQRVWFDNLWDGSDVTRKQFWKVNGSYLSTTMLGISHGVGLDIVTGFSYRWIEIAPVPSNNNTYITCEVIDVNGAVVESNSTMLLIQGTLFSCDQFYVFRVNRS